jgi:uncharacterized membrane protein
MTKLLENQDSKGQKVWVWIIRIIGFIMFIAPLFLPILAYFQTDQENMSLNGGDWIFLLFGFVLSSGGQQIGMVVNNVGIIFSKFLEKLTK